MTGVNIFLSYLTDERVNKVHNDGSFIGLWYVASRTEENTEMWQQVFKVDCCVDFFFSDKPVEAMQARD